MLQKTSGEVGEGKQHDTPIPVFPYISIVIDVIFNMVMTLNEQKVTLGESEIFLQLLHSCFHLCFLLAQGYYSPCFL